MRLNMPISSSLRFDSVATEATATGRPVSTRLLVIACGDEPFTDAGLGRHITRQVSAWQLPGVRGLAVPLLTPDLSPLLTSVELVVFVDATTECTSHPALVPLHPEVSPGRLGQAETPAGLLALAHAVFGRCPPAWILRVPAGDFSPGQDFSATARAGAERALCQLRHLAQGLAGRARTTRA